MRERKEKRYLAEGESANKPLGTSVLEGLLNFVYCVVYCAAVRLLTLILSEHKNVIKRNHYPIPSVYPHPLFFG